MKLRNTAIWLVLFVALGLFAWSLRDSEPRQVGPNAPTPTPNPVFDFEVASVTDVRVEGGGESYDLSRDDADDWLVDGQAASDAVNGVVDGVVNPTVLRVLPEDREADDYGFATPWLTVTFTVSDTQRQLFVGDEVPTSSSDRYVRVGADGALRTVSAFDFERLFEWLTEPPYAPTPTPIATETPEGGEEADAEEESEGEEGDESSMSDEDAAGDEAGDEASADTEDESDPEATEGEDAAGAEDEDAGAGDDEGGEGDESEEAAAVGTPAATETPAADAGDDG